jgi:hypothetical protein
VRLIKHTTGGPNHRSKPELSTLPETGSFYFALTRHGIFLKGYAGLAQGVSIFSFFLCSPVGGEQG